MRLYNPRMAFGSDAVMDVAGVRDDSKASRVSKDGLENGVYSVLQAGDVSHAMAGMAGRNQEVSNLTEVEQIIAAIAAWDGAADGGMHRMILDEEPESVESFHAHNMNDSDNSALLDGASLPEVTALYNQHGISSDDLGVDEAASPIESNLDGIIDDMISTEPAPGLEIIVDERDADAGNEQEAEEPEPPDDRADVLQM